MSEPKPMVLVNQTDFTVFLTTTSAPVRTRTVINVIYISGIVFMVTVFLLLLWVNLCSRRCWCWHDTPLIHRFNRQWLLKQSMHRKSDLSSKHQQRSRQLSHDEELPL